MGEVKKLKFGGHPKLGKECHSFLMKVGALHSSAQGRNDDRHSPERSSSSSKMKVDHLGEIQRLHHF